ncbi:trypsin-like peptidase domain-containing protein [Allorhodopirellula heiligendammensis]|uniref:Trypsin n=1 Tax=Allorhodopirellula heiligendammensis TaxID=2714739 RepID=A0A5C6BCC2_9BACT|nr:trypsin-like peptidase domain-containing protein [Allorhodopirellula heiligendammensis]TWU09743.1 hypothetical protein Poly21_55480 [Allorhodopirellula heiligendammensis]
MSETIPYPSSSVWYIHVQTNGETGQGSGVGIRLRKKGQPGTEETYILTCAHVVRRSGKSDQELGPKHERIWGQPAGYGYDPSGGFSLQMVATVTPLSTYAAASFYEQPVADVESADWALLKFDDPAWSNCRDAKLIAGTWASQELATGDECVISGYPEGHKGFSGFLNGNDHTVRPKPGYNIQKVEKIANSLVTFDGTGSRSGMSGGGVFRTGESNHALSGLHRARYDARLQLKALSARSILQRLDELGYEPVEVSLHKSPDQQRNEAPFSMSDLQADEVIAIATSLLQIAIGDCHSGKQVEQFVGAKGKLVLTLSEFAADSMQRLAVKGSLDLLQAQQSQITSLKDRELSNMFPGTNFAREIERLQVARTETIEEIRGRLRLMIDNCVQLT